MFAEYLLFPISGPEPSSVMPNVEGVLSALNKILHFLFFRDTGLHKIITIYQYHIYKYSLNS